MHKHYNLTEQDGRLLQIKNSLFKNYRLAYGETVVDEAYQIAQILWYISDALGQYRLIEACGRDAILSFQSGKLSETLRRLIVALKN